ncbi:16928_t:CDS:2 [Racocetra persica]|uniref:16928_t:CDS:1 n=1 Tax=Racocetra persica TaxID=160502 RepID=A0ACA9LEV8_9GLOM|nr:16928_t:CDS:2 [Racocetra persica]
MFKRQKNQHLEEPITKKPPSFHRRPQPFHLHQMLTLMKSFKHQGQFTKKITKTSLSTAISPVSDTYPDKPVQTLRQQTAYKPPRFQSSSMAVSPTLTYTDDACHNKTDSISMKPISTFLARDTAKKYNPDQFNIKPSHARFFVMKSYNEDDIHTSIKAFRDNSDKGPIYLFFSVVAR